MIRKLSLLAVAASLAACGATEPGDCELGDRSAYPTESIGLGVGDVLENLSFTAPGGGTFSFGDVFADESNRVMLLTTTAGWCTACIEEQPKLKQLHAEYADKGLVIVAAMFEDADFQPATREQVEAWKAEYELPYHLVLDETFKLEKYYDRASTPMNMLVDLDTMQILKVSTGYDEQAVRAVIEANLCAE